MITTTCRNGAHAFCNDPDCACVADNCHVRCERCSRRTKVLRVGDDHKQVCAACRREDARARPVPQTPCDDCGNAPAFRNPATRKNVYRCVKCHAKAGEPIMLAHGAIGVIADCAGRDAHDSLHEPVHIKGARVQCRKCKAALQKKSDVKHKRVSTRQTSRNHGGNKW